MIFYFPEKNSQANIFRGTKFPRKKFSLTIFNKSRKPYFMPFQLTSWKGWHPPRDVFFFFLLSVLIL